MTNLQVWDPFQDLSKFWDDGLRARSVYRPNLMPIEVEELDGKILVRAKVPGTSREDIDITANQDSITIVVKRVEEKKEGKKGTVHYSEFHKEEEIVRTVALPSGIDTTKVEAELANGILMVSAPTLAGAKERKVQIK